MISKNGYDGEEKKDVKGLDKRSNCPASRPKW